MTNKLSAEILLKMTDQIEKKKRSVNLSPLFHVKLCLAILASRRSAIFSLKIG